MGDWSPGNRGLEQEAVAIYPLQSQQPRHRRRRFRLATGTHGSEGSCLSVERRGVSRCTHNLSDNAWPTCFVKQQDDDMPGVRESGRENDRPCRPPPFGNTFSLFTREKTLDEIHW
jgi:hypothetical protein